MKVVLSRFEFKKYLRVDVFGLVAGNRGKQTAIERQTNGYDTHFYGLLLIYIVGERSVKKLNHSSTMASEEEDVGKILVAMSSDQENEGSTANDASSHGNSDNKGASTTAAAAATVKTSQPKSSNNTSNSGILATSQQQNSSLSGTKRPWEYTAEEQIAKQQFMVGIAWERGYQSLVEYKEKHGNCHVPYRYEGDRSLGTWTARQRKDKDNLSPFQIQKLEEIGFTWQSAQDRVWMEKFERLKSYWGKNGNSCVPTSYEEDPELGEWTAKQRQKYTQGRLSSDRQQLLNTVGFVYRINKFIKRKSTAREDKKWWEQLERLIQFLLEHGHVSSADCFIAGFCLVN